MFECKVEGTDVGVVVEPAVGAVFEPVEEERGSGNTSVDDRAMGAAEGLGCTSLEDFATTGTITGNGDFVGLTVGSLVEG